MISQSVVSEFTAFQWFMTYNVAIPLSDINYNGNLLVFQLKIEKMNG